ncbi:MAG: phenylacetate--CoA ligase [Clostridia bacterium]|nr:phenylacetate--CoA ligase [Clostridia bacterium]
MKYWQEEIETASRETLDSLQSERLIATVKRVYEKVPMYRQRMDEAGVKPEDIKSIKDITKLPFTTKQDLRDTYPYGMFATDLSEVVELHASSGTTGKQIVVGYTEKDVHTWGEICARALVAAGADETDFVHVSYGYGLFTGGFGLHYGAQQIGATAIPVSAGQTKRQVTILEDFGSTILCCTPSYAMTIAEAVEQAGIDASKLPLKAGIFGAEPWTEEMRQYIEDKLKIKAYDIYGLTEVMGPGVSFTCEKQCGMHVNEDHFIIEVLDPETFEPVPDGTIGEIVFTCITKDAFPVIRYRTKDLGYITREKCECGRSFARMSKILGRTDDMLIIRGVNVFPSQIETVLLEQGFAPNYMLVVDRVKNSDTLEVQVEISADMFSDVTTALTAAERKLQIAIRELLGIQATVKLVAPNTLPRFEGKAKRVIDNRKLHD